MYYWQLVHCSDHQLDVDPTLITNCTYYYCDIEHVFEGLCLISWNDRDSQLHFCSTLLMQQQMNYGATQKQQRSCKKFSVLFALFSHLTVLNSNKKGEVLSNRDR